MLSSALSHSLSCVGLFVTLWTTARQASLSVEFSRQDYGSELPFPSLRDLPDPGIEPTSFASPALQADSLPLSHQVLYLVNGRTGIHSNIWEPKARMLLLHYTVFFLEFMICNWRKMTDT